MKELVPNVKDVPSANPLNYKYQINSIEIITISHNIWVKHANWYQSNKTQLPKMHLKHSHIHKKDELSKSLYKIRD